MFPDNSTIIIWKLKDFGCKIDVLIIGIVLFSGLHIIQLTDGLFMLSLYMAVYANCSPGNY